MHRSAFHPMMFGKRRDSAPPPSYHADATALFARWGTDPGATRKGLVNACIQGMDDDTDWALIDVLQVYAAHTQADGLLDWKNNSDATLVNSPTFTTDLGVTTNGSTTYINTNYVPSTDGVNFTQNSAFMGAYINDAGANTASTSTYALGTDDGAEFNIAPHDAVGRIRGFINAAGVTAFTGLTPNTRAGFTAFNRSGASAVQAYRNGASAGTDTTASTGVPAIAIYVGGRNDVGALAGAMDARFAVFLAAGSLDSTRQARVYARLLTYLTAIGAN